MSFPFHFSLSTSLLIPLITQGSGHRDCTNRADPEAHPAADAVVLYNTVPFSLLALDRLELADLEALPAPITLCRNDRIGPGFDPINHCAGRALMDTDST